MLGKVLFDKQVYNSDLDMTAMQNLKYKPTILSYIIITDLYVFYSTHIREIYNIYLVYKIK